MRNKSCRVMGSLRKAEPDNLDGPGAAGLSAKPTDRGKERLGLVSVWVWKKPLNVED